MRLMKAGLNLYQDVFEFDDREPVVVTHAVDYQEMTRELLKACLEDLRRTVDALSKKAGL